MKLKTILVVAVACGVASLAGCSSMSKKGDSSALTSGLTDNVDFTYIEAVNAEANKHFYQVLWVNPPQKHMRTQRN